MVNERCANATLCIDAFHVVQWATDALDEVRREVWNEARKGGMSTHAKELKGCRYALWRNPEDLTPRQEKKLAWIAQVNTKLYRAYLMKEQLRIVIRTKGVLALTILDEWLVGPSGAASTPSSSSGARSKRTSPASRRPCSTTCRTR